MNATIQSFKTYYRDYGLKSAIGLTAAVARVAIARRVVRTTLWATRTEFSYADMWDDFLHDNIPVSWEEKFPESEISDEQMAIAHELLIHFVRNDLDPDPVNDLIPKSRF